MQRFKQLLITLLFLLSVSAVADDTSVTADDLANCPTAVRTAGGTLTHAVSAGEKSKIYAIVNYVGSARVPMLHHWLTRGEHRWSQQIAESPVRIQSLQLSPDIAHVAVNYRQQFQYSDDSLAGSPSSPLTTYFPIVKVFAAESGVLLAHRGVPLSASYRDGVMVIATEHGLVAYRCKPSEVDAFELPALWANTDYKGPHPISQQSSDHVLLRDGTQLSRQTGQVIP